MSQCEPQKQRSFADKLNHLFANVIPAGRSKPYTEAEVAAAIKAQGGKVSEALINKLRKGDGDNPTKRTIEDISTFFQISPMYFFDDSFAKRFDEDLAKLLALRDTGVLRVAQRAVGLSGPSLEVLLAMADRIRSLEGLPHSQAQQQSPTEG